ncbi:MAG: DUF2520 domain-containing protein [Candidatus Kapabacteria bacterium]|nr:DUF2520 domain-containing protein [Candidatus Kapabacteria bacterium]
MGRPHCQGLGRGRQASFGIGYSRLVHEGRQRRLHTRAPFMITNVTIIGAGKVGTSVKFKLGDDGITVAVNLVSAREFLSLGTSVIPSSSASVIVLACRDSQLTDSVALLAEHYAHALTGVLVLHVNGSRGSDVLCPLKEHGALISAAHPFQTFAKADAALLDSIGWGVECDDDAWESTAEFVSLTGGVPFRLPRTDAVSKRRYHAAAVAASNFTYAAYDLARKLAEDVDIPVETFLAPIMRQTVENAIEAIQQGRPFPITGPLVRGDMDAVQRQRQAMPDQLRQQYDHLLNALAEAIGR